MPDRAHAPARSPAMTLAIVAALIIVATWLATWQRWKFESAQAIEATLHANTNLAIAYEENATNAFDDVEQMLRLIEVEIRTHGMTHAAPVLDNWPVNREVIRGLGIANEHGTVLAGTGDMVLQDLSGGEAFEFHRASPGREMRIGRPRRLPLDGPWRVAVSRRLDRAGGRFDGVAMAMVDPAYFTHFYGRADLGKPGLVTLVNRDGYALARHTGKEALFDLDMRSSTLMRNQAVAPSGTFMSAGKLDREQRLMSYRTLPRHGIVVAIGTPRSAALAPVAERVRLYALLAALITCIVGLATAGLIRSVRRRDTAIASLRATEGRLTAQEARMRAISDSMAGGLITTDYDARILTVNRAACEIFGYTAEEMVGHPLAMLAHPTARQELDAITENLHGRTADFRLGSREMKGLRRDGSAVEVEMLVSGVLLGGQWTYIGIVYDIGQRKRIERALRAGELRLRAGFEQSLVGMASTDLAGRFTHVNQALCDMLGYSEAELLQRSYADITHPDDAAVSARIGAQIDKTATAQAAKRYIRKNGSVLWILANVTLIHDDEGAPHHVGMILDITDLKQAERMKSDFVSTVSHELRTPLTSINGSLGLMAAGIAGALPPAAKELTAIAARNCERLIRLVSDILDVEKLAAGRMQLDIRPGDLGVLLRHAFQTNEGFARARGVSVGTTASGEGLEVAVDADRFNQVMTNLISNAVKFSPEGGQVDVTAVRHGDRVRIEVRDDGPGIPLEFRGRIFQRFSQAQTPDSGRKGGTGLGLCIAKSIVEALGGTIGYESEIGKGTTFHVELPLAPADKVPAPAARIPEESTQA